MERKMIISLLIGYITALLPIWDWNTRLELFAGTYDRGGCQSIRRHAEKKIKSSCTGIHEPGFRHLRQLQYNKYNTQAAECQFRQE